MTVRWRQWLEGSVWQIPVRQVQSFMHGPQLRKGAVGDSSRLMHKMQ